MNAGTAPGGDERTEVFQRHRRLLFTVAYDLLGEIADAEDCVQETWLRWAGADRSGVADPKNYLVRIAANTALNRLRAIRARRESYTGPWLPEPLASGPDVADRVELADEVSFAMLVVLETLGPMERAVFVLREVFGFPHAEIAGIVDASEAAVRQTAHRARERVRSRRPRFRPTAEERRRLTERFWAACAMGDIDGLTGLLAEDAVVHTDGGGKVSAALRPIHGADRAARFLCAVSADYADHRVLALDLNRDPGMVVYGSDGSVAAAGLLEMAGGRVTEVFVVRNPDKLRHLPVPE